MSNNIFIRDQIYILSKEPNKNTNLEIFLDYDLREDENFEKIYLEGRVEGLPFIDDSILD